MQVSSFVAGAMAAGLALLPLSVTPSLSAEATASIGDIAITYDDTVLDLWVGLAPPKEGERLMFRLVDEREDRLPGTIIVINAEPDKGEPFEPDSDLFNDPFYDGRPLWQDDGAASGSAVPPFRDFGGLLVQGWIFHTGCRNWTPPMYVAEGVHEGIRYRFRTGLPVGCRGVGSFVIGDAFEMILNGVSLRAAESD